MTGINDQELLLEQVNDEFASYFNDGNTPKILITTSDRPRKRTAL